MDRKLTRRDSLKLMGSAAIGSGLMGSAPLSRDLTRLPVRDGDMRGIFVILSTPYTESGAVDYEDLAFQVEWLDHAGVHGLVWPQNSSDYPRLRTAEIRRGMEVLTEANRGRSMTLVLGVQQDASDEMVELAGFAERLEPDMMIAMPPKVGTSLSDYRAYYTALAHVTERPVMIQTQPNLPGVEFDTDFILELASRYPHLGYVKEEAQPVFDRIQALVGQPQIQRVYSAMRGRYFAYDLRLGVDGLVSGMAMYAEAFVRMWEAREAGDWDETRDVHARLLVMLTCETAIPGAGRYLLQRRGIFKSRAQRGRDVQLSDAQIAEIEHNLRGLEPYLKEGPRRG
ncbi:MAG: dihydrodipicolinate synthase family protein [Gemmatimonadota bacterium]|nr:dihydrodipicolinate synthase family protein [Gemmatimonadota bacterium]MDH3422397.1 dihydrodipicolinate synthase family protein [Gemmatimonadota bacterium]